jgi:hypothetical protein
MVLRFAMSMFSIHLKVARHLGDTLKSCLARREKPVRPMITFNS